MFEKFIRLFRIKDLRKKILFVLFVLAISRLVASVPIPGIDPEKLQQFFSGNQFFGMLSVFTGGSMGRMSIGMLVLVHSLLQQLLCSF